MQLGLSVFITLAGLSHVLVDHITYRCEMRLLPCTAAHRCSPSSVCERMQVAPTFWKHLFELSSDEAGYQLSTELLSDMWFILLPTTRRAILHCASHQLDVHLCRHVALTRRDLDEWGTVIGLLNASHDVPALGKPKKIQPSLCRKHYLWAENPSELESRWKQDQLLLLRVNKERPDGLNTVSVYQMLDWCFIPTWSRNTK